MYHLKTMIFALVICLFSTFGILFYEVHNVHNKLLTTQKELKEMQEVIDKQSDNISELLVTQKNLESEMLKLQKETKEFIDHNITSAQDVVEHSNQENRWDITLTETEIHLLARIVMLEAGGESGYGKNAVVEVIFNRMYHDDFPDTLEDVLSEDNPVQFTTWKNRNIKQATPTVEVYKSIYYVLSGHTDILPYETVYFGRSAQNNKIEVIIEDHVFCNK